MRIGEIRKTKVSQRVSGDKGSENRSGMACIEGPKSAMVSSIE